MTLRGGRRRSAWLVALLALVCLGAATYEESFLHTDDGCQVEIHCLACRLLLGAGVGPAVATPDVAPAVVASRHTLPSQPIAHGSPALTATGSRAPPLS